MKTIQDKQNEIITVLEEDCVGQSLTLKSLSNCTVDLQGVIGALYIYSCTNCVIKAVFVKSACNIYKCTDSSVELVSQQMRINESSNMKFSLLTRSDPALVESGNAVHCKPDKENTERWIYFFQPHNR